MVDLPRINIGSVPNSPNADTVRDAFGKINTIAHILEQPNHILGPALIVEVDSDITYDADLHLNRILVLADDLYEVTITIPSDTPVGHSFTVAAMANSWPVFAMSDSSGSLLHPYDHVTGLPKGLVSAVVLSNADGHSAVVVLTGATQT